MRVFISHSGKDKPAVVALAEALRARGIDAWLDKWEINAGDDIVARINAGLDEADAGIIVFSRHSSESRWVEAEVSYLTFARIEEQKTLIPVMLGADAFVPPLLRPLARRSIDEIDSLVDALLHRQQKPALAHPAEHGRIEHVLMTLRRAGETGVRTELRIGEELHGATDVPALPNELVAAQAAFVRGFRRAVRSDLAAMERQAREVELARLGHALGALCLPDGSGAALASLIDGCPVGTTVETCVEADDPKFLGLAFEAMRLPDGRVLALQPSVVVMRRPLGLNAAPQPALAGPVKILVAVAAPDQGVAASAALDHERELQSILDAVEPARRLENCDVRILEVGHPEVIGDAIKSDAYHVLHLSCHGLPGALELEDEEGRAVVTTAAALLAPIRQAGRPLPLVLLNTCHGGVPAVDTASLAEALLRGGVPAVVAMQAPVSDVYATGLAKSFYEHLARRENFLASRALADARKELERLRLDAVGRGGGLEQTWPEFATAGLYVSGTERPFADFAADKQPLRARPVFDVPGPVPQLRLDDLIGRRRELRETLDTLRETGHQHAGVVLTGIGGVGKSAVAGRVMCRLAEDGWLVRALRGRLDLVAVAATLGSALLASGREADRRLGELLARPDLDDRVRQDCVGRALTENRILLVLDDFEDNLATGGDAFLDAAAADTLRFMAQSARNSRLLLTCRYPVPETDAWLRRIAVGPLTLADTRKLLLRLPGLSAAEASETAMIMRLIGGHPRMLEYLDAVLRGGKGRLPALTDKLRRIAQCLKLDLATPVREIAAGIQAALTVGARDVLLADLLDIARREGIEGVLLQAAVSNLPVTPDGLARMLADDRPGDVPSVTAATERLETLSLLHRFPEEGVWVHRWTAEGLARLVDAAAYRACSLRAGRYRWWRIENEGGSFEHAIEGVRNFLVARDYGTAVAAARACFDALRRWQRSAGIAALAGEILETLPEDDAAHASVADEEARAHLALGRTDRALARYRQVLGRMESRAAANPDRADDQRDLSVAYNKLGDLYGALGQGEEARVAYQKSLAIFERLAQAEPDRADYQRDLSASYNRMGDLYGALGQGDEARAAYQKSLAIAERLAQAEPDRADYQRDLSVSYERMGDLYSTLRQGDEARAAYQKSLAIAERLAQAEPDRADYQRDLSVSYNKMGDLYGALGQGQEARAAYQKSLAIRERLAQAEPDRADYQRDLSVSYNKIGDLFRALGQGNETRQYYLKDLAIAERLAQAEPDRADYQRDLSVSYERMGDLSRALGQGEEARVAYQKSLAIAERLAQKEPDRADYQRDLIVSCLKMSESDPAQARRYLMRGLEIVRALQARGGLSPADAWLPEDLARRLAELPNS